MGSLSNYAEDAMIKHLFDTAYAPVATVYLALATAEITDASTGATMTEVVTAGTAYARTAIPFGVAGSRRITQNADVTFPEATAAWGVVTYWAIMDSDVEGAGNILAYGSFVSSFSPILGQTPSIASGQIYVEVTASVGEGWTTQLCNWMLDLMFRNQAYAQPDTWIALLDAVGADADTTLTTAGKEAAGLNYARVQVNKVGGAAPAWAAIGGGATQNAGEIAFPVAGLGGYSEVVGIAIVDGGVLDAGNVLMYDNDQVVNQTPNAGDTVKFAVGDLDVSLS